MNVEKHDLAIIVRDPCPENIGRIVEVMGPGKVLLDAPAWFCVAQGAPLTVINADSPSETYLDCCGDVYDADLKPVSGLPITDDIKDEVTL